MDAATLTAFLAPVLPFLLKVGSKAAEGAMQQVGVDTWGKAKAVWEKLRPKVEEKEAAKEAAEDVAAAPDDEDLQAALRVQLKKILEKNEALAKEIAQLMNSDAPTGLGGTTIQQKVTGDQNKSIGQMQGSGKVIGNVDGNVTM